MATINLRKLAASISENNSVSDKNSQKILENLNLSELKELAAFLRNEEEKNTLEVVSSDNLSQESKKELLKHFSGMRIKENLDKNLGAGIKIKAYDMIYDLTLKGSIDSIVEKIEDSL